MTIHIPIDNLLPWLQANAPWLQANAPWLAVVAWYLFAYVAVRIWARRDKELLTGEQILLWLFNPLVILFLLVGGVVASAIALAKWLARTLFPEAKD